MADRRKGGRKKPTDPNQKLTKEEDTIARYVRFNCPTKTTMFEGNEVHYFTGTKAVDTLYESKKYGHAAKNIKFATRQAAAMFMRSLLEKGLFFRARKLVPKKKEKDQKEKGDVSKSPKKKFSKGDQAEKEKEKEKKEERKEESDDNDEENGKEQDKKKEDEKKKRKIRLELHQEQSFNDANDVYVWIFDPTPLFKKIIGALMVLGTIAGCLFPLWPMWLRQGVYYISVCGLACFGLLIGVSVARTILFAVIWAVTMGRHKLWLLPNLTEDCGFFESFQPWYTYEYCSGGFAGNSKKKKKIDGKKKSDDEELVADKKRIKGGHSDSHATELDEKIEKEKQSQRKESGDGNADSCNGDENDETDEVVSSDSDGRRSQETNGSINNGGDTGSGGDGDDEHKIRLRRRARKADDDFVLVDK